MRLHTLKDENMKAICTLSACLLLGGCVTLSGQYSLHGEDSRGQPALPKMMIHAHGSQIYSMRRGLCGNPNVHQVRIFDSASGVELASESPYRCP